MDFLPALQPAFAAAVARAQAQLDAASNPVPQIDFRLLPPDVASGFIQHLRPMPGQDFATSHPVLAFVLAELYPQAVVEHLPPTTPDAST